MATVEMVGMAARVVEMAVVEMATMAGATATVVAREKESRPQQLPVRNVSKSSFDCFETFP
jgi:carbonic anhydrase/acetyltransferase-like protein (isoleucine patch superfamily)